jgi:hypothetical protein
MSYASQEATFLTPRRFTLQILTLFVVDAICPSTVVTHCQLPVITDAVCLELPAVSLSQQARRLAV